MTEHDKVKAEVARVLAEMGWSEWATKYHVEWSDEGEVFFVVVMEDNAVRDYYRSGGMWDYHPVANLFYDYNDYLGD